MCALCIPSSCLDMDLGNNTYCCSDKRLFSQKKGGGGRALLPSGQIVALRSGNCSSLTGLATASGQAGRGGGGAGHSVVTRSITACPKNGQPAPKRNSTTTSRGAHWPIDASSLTRPVFHQITPAITRLRHLSSMQLCFQRMIGNFLDTSDTPWPLSALHCHPSFCLPCLQSTMERCARSCGGGDMLRQGSDKCVSSGSPK